MYAPGGISVASLTSIMASGSAGDFFFWMFTLDNGWCFYQNTYTSPGNFVCRFLGGVCIYASHICTRWKKLSLSSILVVNLISAPHVREPRAAQYHTLPGMFCKFQHFAQRLQAIKVGWQLLSTYNVSLRCFLKPCSYLFLAIILRFLAIIKATFLAVSQQQKRVSKSTWVDSNNYSRCCERIYFLASQTPRIMLDSRTITSKVSCAATAAVSITTTPCSKYHNDS